jgi:outer membrane receptor for ferrienterochelin and colicins
MLNHVKLVYPFLFFRGKRIFFSLSIMVLTGFVCFAQEKGDTTATDLMSLSLEQLLNVKIKTASKYEEAQVDAPAIISVLTRDDLSRFGGISLVEILNRIPGLICSHVTFSEVPAIAVRGDLVKGTSSHVLILINGRPMREILEGGVSCDILNVFPVDIIERIEVIKGPGSVMYGSDAFTAVINIITRSAEKSDFSVKTITSTDLGYGGSGQLLLRKGDARIVLGARYLQKAVFNKSYNSTSALTGNDTIYKAHVPNKGPGIYFGVNYNSLSLMAGYNDYTGNSMENQGQYWTKSFANIAYNQEISERWKMDVNVGITHSTLDVVDFTARSSDNIVAEVTNFIKVSDCLNIVTGGVFGRIAGKETLRIPGLEGTISAEGERNNYALYGQLEYDISKALRITGGVQANKPQGIGFDIVPRFALNWNPVNNFTVKVLYSEAFRAPSITELYVRSPHTIGNENLRPEKVSDVDLKFIYQNESVSFGLGVFQSDQSGIIVRNGNIYTNLQKIRFRGIEADGEQYINPKIYVNASLIYQVSRSDTANNVSPVANIGAKAGISYKSGKKLTVSLFDIYQGPLDKKYAVGCKPAELSFNLLNLYCEYALLSPGQKGKTRIALYLQSNNLLDDKYRRYDMRGATTPAVSGRETYLGVNFTF